MDVSASGGLSGLRFGHHATAAAGAGWGLLAAVGAGVVLVIYGEVTAVSPLVAVATSRITSLVLIVLLALRFGAGVPRGLRGSAVLSGALEAAGFILIVTALTVGPVATASVLAAQFATFAVLLGLIVGRERPRRLQLVGVAVTIVAVTVLALA